MVARAGQHARRRLLPAVLMWLGLLSVALAVHRSRLALDLTGGRLAPLPSLAETWSSYFAEWHPVAGGTAAAAPASLAMVGLLGVLYYPLGGPAAGVSILLVGSIPLAGLSAYLACRRIGVPRWARALAATVYALLPVGVQAAVQGRLDGVIVHILLPLVLSGVMGVLSGLSVGRGGPRGWLPSACGTALGLAVVSAFAPLLHLVVLAFVLVGFVVVPGLPGRGLRRVVALFLVVMLPLGLLLPWPAVWLTHPEVVLHGTGLAVPEPKVPLARLAALDAGWLGAVVAAGALFVVLVRPRKVALPGLVLALIGFGVAVVVNTVTAAPLAGGEPRPGWPGPALLVAACGLLWAALGTLAAGPRPLERGRHTAQGGWRWDAVAAGVTAMTGLVAVALVAGALLTGGSALLRERPRLAAPVQAEVSAHRTGVLVVGAPGEPVRSAVARLPAFGDDDLAPVRAGPARMARWAAAFRSGQPSTTRSAVLDAAVSGIEFVVLPDRPGADLMAANAGDLVTGAPPTSDGRPVLRLLPPPTARDLPAQPTAVVVLPAQLAGKARTGGAPPEDYATADVVAVPASPPNVDAEISAGTQGRVLVVAAEDEPGWQVTVDGKRAEASRAWGHLVAVVLPANRANVRIERSGAVRVLLLLAQLAVALFTTIAAIPPAAPAKTASGSQGGGDAPSTASGSRPR